MSEIMILDCTLRDGGYINEWNFGERTIKRIISKLTESKIDIIECGFIEEGDFDPNKSLFEGVERIIDYIGPKSENITYVGMIAQPYIPIDKISDCNGRSIDGIRLTFHEHEVEEALIYGKQLIEKGYKVFIQPVGTTSYSDSGLLELVEKVNDLKPYAFYLVDTLGIMYKNDLLRMFHLLDNNLVQSISIGFHSHNNLQLSFSNAQELLMLHTKRNIIIDSSVMGMGRGAGNLCTELVTNYINENIEERYDTIPLLEIIDEHLSHIFTETKWGYSIPYYLAAVNSCHPNYASHLLNKQTISVKAINTILKQLPIKKRDLYDKSFIEDLYINYQSNFVYDADDLHLIKEMISGREILIIGPGKSIELEKEMINNFINRYDPFVCSVNFIPDSYKVDAVFISNLKRFESIADQLTDNVEITALITTSNITKSKEVPSLTINYSDLLINNPVISDNAGLMLINLFHHLSVKSLYLAGFDGFSINKNSNYFSADMNNNAGMENLIKINEEISDYLLLLGRKINIQFITKTVYSDTAIDTIMQ
ncbi:aldolase catalytic domain-containing protein [Neobacillus niacini]|uniref:aldolase catalytic domain-containing protein n=1 Tax=Neobacillus niacini TaxID=86668 RepID=UPI0021CB3941|nr:aldolase catalytic domain-containing protein [Neobacillus niacini]MCM3765955.1 aldolase catalytic domain-containing protein [Neobacillus niacini]